MKSTIRIAARVVQRVSEIDACLKPGERLRDGITVFDGDGACSGRCRTSRAGPRTADLHFAVITDQQ
jgi:hypothetical protein